MESIEKKTFEVSTELMKLSDLTKEFASKSRSENSMKAYRKDWEDFELWCITKGFRSMPADPHVVSVYIADRATNPYHDTKGKPRNPLKVSSIERRLCAISQIHEMAGHEFDKKHPVLRDVWKGIKKTLGLAQDCKEPILIEDLRCMIDHIDITGNKKVIGTRDRALLLIGFSGAFRRSEIAGLKVEDLHFVKEGIIVNLRRSKTDQMGVGRKIAIPYGSNPLTCPVRSLKDWLELSGIESGAIFRHVDRHGNISDVALRNESIALIIKRNGHLEGRSGKFSGHSLRAGFVTTTAMAGVSESIIMRQTGHKSSDTLRKYIRIGDIWRENAALKAGL